MNKHKGIGPGGEKGRQQSWTDLLRLQGLTSSLVHQILVIKFCLQIELL